MDWRLGTGECPLEQHAALGLRCCADIAAVDGQQIEGDECGRCRLCQLRDARGRWMQTHLQRVEVEPARGGDDDLAVHHAAIREVGKQRLVQFGKVTIERPEIPALDEELGATAKDDRAKPVPLGLVQKRATAGDPIGGLREHRLDRRSDRESLRLCHGLPA